MELLLFMKVSLIIVCIVSTVVLIREFLSIRKYSKQIKQIRSNINQAQSDMIEISKLQAEIATI